MVQFGKPVLWLYALPIVILAHAGIQDCAIGKDYVIERKAYKIRLNTPNSFPSSMPLDPRVREDDTLNAIANIGNTFQIEKIYWILRAFMELNSVSTTSLCPELLLSIQYLIFKLVLEGGFIHTYPSICDLAGNTLCADAGEVS